MQLHNYILYDLYTTYIFLATQIYNVRVTAAPLTERENGL